MSDEAPDKIPNALDAYKYPKGVSGNPKGKAKGTLSMSTRIRKALNGKVDWDKISINSPGLAKLKKRYGNVTVAEALIWVQTSKALAGDTQAFIALRDGGWGRMIKFEETAKLEVVHILKPEKLEIAQLESAAEQLRQRAEAAVEAELVNELDSTSGTADVRAINT